MKPKRNDSGLLAFTRIELVSLIAILALIVVLTIPTMHSAGLYFSPKKVQRINCVNNLKQIALAYKTWAADCGDLYPMETSTNESGTFEYLLDGRLSKHFQGISNDLITIKILICPADVRMVATNFESLENKNISYFVGLDGNDSRILDFLSGDRNITNGVAPVNSVLTLNPKISTGWKEALHMNQGNIGLADGSVQLYSSAQLQQAVVDAGPTNRIALPE